jgi:hypothetical protein
LPTHSKGLIIDTWKIESNPGKQTAIALACMVAGLVLATGFRNFDGTGMTNSLAGFLLGLLLLLIGVAGVLTGGKQTIVVDPKARRILIEDTSRFGKKTRSISFNEIVGVSVSLMGKRSSGTITYYLVLRLETGKTYPLFFPAYFEGRWDRSVAESRCRRLEEYLKQPA